MGKNEPHQADPPPIWPSAESLLRPTRPPRTHQLPPGYRYHRTRGRRLAEVNVDQVLPCEEELARHKEALIASVAIKQSWDL
jgi:hypothetical protein